MTFTRNEVRGTHLVFEKRRFQCFISEILRVVGLLGEKFTFFNSLGTTKISRSLKHNVYINVVLLINFQNNLNYTSTSDIREVIKFYNLGDKTFETDFSYIVVFICLQIFAAFALFMFILGIYGIILQMSCCYPVTISNISSYL